MLRDFDRYIFLDMAAYFLSALFNHERAEPTNVNILPFRKATLYFFEKSLQSDEHIYFRDACFL